MTFFRWLFKNSFQLRKLLKKLPVVTHKQRFPSNSEPNWPSYLSPLLPQYSLHQRSLGCSFRALYRHHCFLSSQPLHKTMDIWPTKQANFAMFFPPVFWYHRASVLCWWKAQEYSIGREERAAPTYHVLSETSPEAPELLQCKLSVWVELCIQLRIEQLMRAKPGCLQSRGCCLHVKTDIR